MIVIEGRGRQRRGRARRSREKRGEKVQNGLGLLPATDERAFFMGGAASPAAPGAGEAPAAGAGDARRESSIERRERRD